MSSGLILVRRVPGIATTMAAIGLIVVAVFALGIGAVGIHPLHVIDALGHFLGIPGAGQSVDDVHSAILVSVRLPRVILGILAGAVLGMTGVLMQAFFRNPLADPALIGVSSGGALGAVAMIVLGASFFSGLSDQVSVFALPVAAFIGSLFATTTVFILARHEGRVNVSTMLLCGIAVNAIAGAGIGLMSFIADDAQLRDLTFWSLGSLGAASWWQVQAVTPAFLAIVLSAPILMAALNALLLGDSEAQNLGYRVEYIKLVILLLTCVGAGAVVATCGVIGFIGLIGPHLARLIVGPDHRFALPLSGLLGAILLTLADIIARTSVAPSELPIGVLTALIGGPVFLWLLRQKNTGGAHA